MTDEIIFYSAEPDPERLVATTVADAVEEAVDLWARPPKHGDTIDVTSYRRMKLPSRESIADTVIDGVIDWLDEEHGDPEGVQDSIEEAKSLREDALCFADAVRQKYKSWACEPVETETVFVRDYVPADWMEKQ